MHTQYSMEIRLLMCPACGAPLEANALGGVVECRFCHVHSECVPRGKLAAFQPMPPPQISEAERMTRLWAQTAADYLPPPGVAALTEPGPSGVTIPAHRQAEALATWQRARARCQAHQAIDAAEDLLFLTNLFATQHIVARDWTRHRAMIESAFEAVFLPRHRTELAADLVCSACRDGDLVAAERWFELVDAHSDDLMADSNYRLARSRLFAAKGDWNGVLAVLGASAGQVPIHRAFVENLTARRADAWEKLGRVDVAVSELVAKMQANPVHRNVIAAITKAHGICAISYPMAEGQVAAALAAAQAEASVPSQGSRAGLFAGVFAVVLVLGVAITLFVILSAHR